MSKNFSEWGPGLLIFLSCLTENLCDTKYTHSPKEELFILRVLSWKNSLTTSSKCYSLRKQDTNKAPHQVCGHMGSSSRNQNVEGGRGCWSLNMLQIHKGLDLCTSRVQSESSQMAYLPVQRNSFPFTEPEDNLFLQLPFPAEID